MPHLTIDLKISADELLEYYRGTARTVHAIATNGQTVDFPASALQRHITKDGIHGRFRLRFDEHHKLLSLEKDDPAPGFNTRA
ncbi:MAG TPA: DUF2835 domain-containing protein [Verrucomicrobiales bacterium]|nr:DUF2835 domain-containing protein [Verrucomicrobiales bacterium]